MNQFEDEFFGQAEKIALMRRALNLSKLLRDDQRFAYYGRLVALSEPGDDPLDTLVALAGIQGAGVGYFVPKESVPDLFLRAGQRGLKTDRHEHFRGAEASYSASRVALDVHSLPDDLAVHVFDRNTPHALVRETAAFWESCEVMPVPGSIMRGVSIPGICLAATDASGAIVSAAASFMLHHPASSHAKDAFWGMLATRPDRRGQKISLLLGARAIAHMWEVHGARGFMTGVRADNASSQALCNRLGVHDTPWIYANIIDAAMMPGGKITK